MSCCKNDLGAFPHSKDIDTGIVTPIVSDVPINITWHLVFTGINGTKFELDVDILEGENIIIPQGFLNEDMYYCFTAYKIDSMALPPTNEYIKVNDCDNFCLRIFILTNNTCGNTCPVEEIVE